jgi:carbon monoxide dehydrogenase subunit G
VRIARGVGGNGGGIRVVRVGITGLASKAYRALLTFATLYTSTGIRYEGDVQVGGMIAGVGQRLLDTTSRFLIKKFSEKLTTEAAAQMPQAADRRDRPSVVEWLHHTV